MMCVQYTYNYKLKNRKIGGFPKNNRIEKCSNRIIYEFHASKTLQLTVLTWSVFGAVANFHVWNSYITGGATCVTWRQRNAFSNTCHGAGPKTSC